MLCALVAMQAQADSGGPMRFVRQAYQAPSCPRRPQSGANLTT